MYGTNGHSLFINTYTVYKTYPSNVAFSSSIGLCPFLLYIHYRKNYKHEHLEQWWSGDHR